jgi:hypothetical protein
MCTACCRFFHLHNVSGSTMALGLTQPLTEMNIGIFPGGKDGRCVRLTTLPTSYADCLEIWEPQPTLQACNGIAVPFALVTTTCTVSTICSHVFSTLLTITATIRQLAFLMNRQCDKNSNLTYRIDEFYLKDERGHSFIHSQEISDLMASSDCWEVVAKLQVSAASSQGAPHI